MFYIFDLEDLRLLLPRSVLLTIYIFLTVGLLIDPWRDDPEVSSGDEIDPENISFEETLSLLCCKICGLRYASLRYRS